MKRLLLFVAFGIFLTWALASCKVLQTKVCPAIKTACPVISSLLDVGITFTVSPTNNIHEVLVTGKNVQSIVCDISNGLCAEIDSALANGKSVEITPVNYSTNKTMKTTTGTKYVVFKLK